MLSAVPLALLVHVIVTVSGPEVNSVTVLPAVLAVALTIRRCRSGSPRQIAARANPPSSFALAAFVAFVALAAVWAEMAVRAEPAVRAVVALLARVARGTVPASSR